MPLSDNEIKKIDAIEDSLANDIPVENLAEKTPIPDKKNDEKENIFKDSLPIMGVFIPLRGDKLDEEKMNNKKHESIESKMMGDVSMPFREIKTEEPEKVSVKNPRRHGLLKTILEKLLKK